MADAPAAGAAPKTRKLRKQEVAEGLSATDLGLSAADPRLVGSAVKAGPLQKRSEQGLLHNWKKRHVVLTEALLYYFETEASAKPQGEPLSLAPARPLRARGDDTTSESKAIDAGTITIGA
jgi:hypothetical protein